MCSGHSIDDDSARNKAVWAYTDDNKSVEILPLDGIPPDLLQNVVIVWLVVRHQVCLWNSLTPLGRRLMFLRDLQNWQRQQRTAATPEPETPQPTTLDPMAAILAAMPAFPG